MAKIRTSGFKAGIAPAVTIFCCAAFLRGIYLYQSSDNPTFLAPVVDSLSYDLMARDFVNGSGITRDFFWQQFFYPFFLSIVYFIGNSSIILAKLIQLALGSVTCVVTYYLGKKIFSRRVVISVKCSNAAEFHSLFSSCGSRRPLISSMPLCG